MSSIGWLPRGLEQHAAPILQLLPIPFTRKYRVGGSQILVDATAANFKPHFWLYVLSTSRWRMGYDQIQRPTHEIELYQGQVFGVLLVDYWQPPYELWRTDQPLVYSAVTIGAQDATPAANGGSADNAASSPTFTEDDAAFTPSGSAG